MCGDKRRTHSIQLVIIGPDNQIVQVPAYGKFHCELNALWYRNNNNVDSLIQLRSPQMRLKYPSGPTMSGQTLVSSLSAQPYPTFITTAAHQIGGLNGAIHWDAELYGTIELQMWCLNGNAIDATDYCVINIDLTPIEEGGSQ